eukprot:2363909-Rhodomonas_salina.3
MRRKGVFKKMVSRMKEVVKERGFEFIMIEGMMTARIRLAAKSLGFEEDPLSGGSNAFWWRE